MVTLHYTLLEKADIFCYVLQCAHLKKIRKSQADDTISACEISVPLATPLLD